MRTSTGISCNLCMRKPFGLAEESFIDATMAVIIRQLDRFGEFVLRRTGMVSVQVHKAVAFKYRFPFEQKTGTSPRGSHAQSHRDPPISGVQLFRDSSSISIILKRVIVAPIVYLRLAEFFHFDIQSTRHSAPRRPGRGAVFLAGRSTDSNKQHRERRR